MMQRTLRQILTGALTVLTLTCLLPHSGWAQDSPTKKHYELARYIPTGIHEDKFAISAENMELCKAYEANLNAFPEVNDPFVCERPIHPRFKEFRKPEWKELDPSNYVDLIVETGRLQYQQFPRPYPFNEAAARKGVLQGITLGRIRLKLAELDIVSDPDSPTHQPDGIPEKVLRIEIGDPHCDPSDEKWRHFPPAREYYIVNDDLTKVEVFEATLATMDVFLYKGKVYFDWFTRASGPDPDSPEFENPGDWHPGPMQERYEIRVYEPYRNRLRPICRYRYVE